MGLPTLGTHRLPVQPHRDHHRRLPERRAAQRQSRSPRRMVQPIAPHGPRLGYGHMPQPALEKVRDRQRHLLEPRTRAVSFLMPRATGEGDTRAIPGHEARVLDGTAPQVTSQIRHSPYTVRLALHDAHLSARLPWMAETVEQVEHLLRTQPLRHHQLSARPRTPDRVEPLAPQDRHDDPRRQQKPMADSLPGPVWRHATARDQTMHMGMQHQGLAPGVECRHDPRLRAQILGVRQ